MKASAPALKISWYTTVNGNANSRTEAPTTPRIDRIRGLLGTPRSARAGWSGFNPRVDERVDPGGDSLKSTHLVEHGRALADRLHRAAPAERGFQARGTQTCRLAHAGCPSHWAGAKRGQSRTCGRR